MSERKAERPLILVVEDEESLRSLMRLWLERQGYRVQEAQNGLEAIEVAEAFRPDLIFMDLSLPRIDGIAATKRIREHEFLHDVPIVAVSACVMEEFRDEALAAGCNMWVTKPFNEALLQSVMQRFLT